MAQHSIIPPGTLLIQPDAPRPPCFHIEQGDTPGGWLPVTHNLTARELESTLAAQGWSFFFMAGPISAAAFGWHQEERLKVALHRLIQGVRRQRCNCLVIESVSARKFLGIPYVTVIARPRHIQQGMTFTGKWHRETGVTQLSAKAIL